MPYGIPMVQATDESLAGAAAAVKNSVLICVLDTGIDIRNPEFAGSIITGTGLWIEGVRADWASDTDEHGTHVSGACRWWRPLQHAALCLWTPGP